MSELANGLLRNIMLQSDREELKSKRPLASRIRPCGFNRTGRN